jgi:hypothetical protein
VSRSALALALSSLALSNCGDQPNKPVAASAILPEVQELPEFSAELSVRQSYRAIPHHQTSWRYRKSSAQSGSGQAG